MNRGFSAESPSASRSLLIEVFRLLSKSTKVSAGQIWELEAVATPGQRLDEPRILRRISQRLAQFVDRGIQAVVEVDEGVGGPDLGAGSGSHAGAASR